jgi:GTP-binding protein LepA
VVFAGIYPEDADDYEDLEKALEKLCLTDASVKLTYESSAALGSGFRCGFLGMLHMDVFRQRLKDEFGITAIVTQPSVAYLCKLRNKKSEDINDDASLTRVDNPTETPKAELIQAWKEAICSVTIITPREYLKGIKTLCEDRRGLCTSEDFMSSGKVINLKYDIPLAEMVTDFFDVLKSLSQGYASLDYEHSHYQVADIKKVVFALNGDEVDALSFLIHENNVRRFASAYAKKLKEILPP